MTGESLKLGKVMTDQVANMFSHVWWLCVISTPGPSQIVFGKNSNLPNIISDTLTALEKVTTSADLASETSKN